MSEDLIVIFGFRPQLIRIDKVLSEKFKYYYKQKYTRINTALISFEANEFN